jgi:IPT/TIG domain
MWRGVPRISLLGIAVVVGSIGCGGAGGAGGDQPPPPQPDFSIELSSSSINVQQGGTSAPVVVSVAGQNGFTGSVQVALSGLPAGITSNPASPFAIAAGQTVSVIFGAASNTAPGQFTISAQGMEGMLSHSEPFSISVQAISLANLPRSVFARNDSVNALDYPSGEPHHRHMMYDARGNRFFVANCALNRVEVFSTPGLVMQTTIDAPGASSVDISADGSTVWVGTRTEQILAIDTGSLQVRERVPMAGLTPVPAEVFIRPTELVSLASGKLLVRLKQAGVAEALLALLDPASRSLTDLTSIAPSLFQAGLGVMARSVDRTRVLVAANDSSGAAGVLDANGNLNVGVKALGAGAISLAAADGTGSHFAMVASAGGNSQVLLVDENLNLLASYNTSGVTGLVFSSDGENVYVAESSVNGRVISALSASNLRVLGQVQDLALQGLATGIEEVDASQLVCGLGNRGISCLDASQPGTISQVAPTFATAPAAQPSEGESSGGTALNLSGNNFSTGAEVRFGSLNPTSATETSASQLQVSSPASVTTGPVNLMAYFSNGGLALAPDGFSYGPTILRVFPNAGASSGGDTIFILGYGFGSAAGNVTVKIGGQSGAVQKVETLPSFSAGMGLDPAYPFALERITVTTPPGTAGKADISLSATSGSTMLAKSFQYLGSSQTYPNPALYKFVLYDQPRQKIYLTATDHIDAFDLKASVFGSAMEPPPNGPPPDAALRGLALTPDGSQLIVADFGAQSVYLINPDGGANNGATVPVGGVAGYLNSGPARVAATSAQTVFVGLTGDGGTASGCNACLGQMNLTAFPPVYQPAPQPEVTSVIGAPLLQTDATGAVVYLAFVTAPGGPVAQWNATSPNLFTLGAANELSTDLTTSADGTMFAMLANDVAEIRDASLSLISTPTAVELETIPNRVEVPGITMHPSGALVYEPFLDGAAPSAPPAAGIHGGIDIRDAHNGRLRLRVMLPEAFAMLSTDVDGLHGSFLTVDENGQRLFAVTTSGLTVVQLNNVPLGIGTLSVTSGASSGGTSTTLRGSGFSSGINVTFGGKAARASFKDMNTLVITTPAMVAGPQQLVLTNPDGESVSLDAAFIAQ